MAIRSQLAQAEVDPLISVIIPAYNDAKYLPESIGSVLGQTYENLECIIVDDGSTDDTENLVAQFAEKDARIRYFKKVNGGVSSARNVGVTKAKGSLIQFLDADDLLHSEKLANGVRFIREHGICDEKFIVYSDYEIVWGNFDDEAAERQALCLVGLDKHGLKQKIIGRNFGLASPSPLHVSSVLLSRAVVEEYQFNESMLGYEDLELFTRLLYTDINFFYAPMIGFYYRVRPGSLSKSQGISRIGYLQFLESISVRGREDLRLCPNMYKVLISFVTQRNFTMFKRAMRLVEESTIPVYSGRGTDKRRLVLLLDRLGVYWSLLRFRVSSARVKRRIGKVMPLMFHL